MVSSVIETRWQDYALDPAIGEREFTEHVRQLAIRGGWLYYHTHDSRRSPPGFPDIVLIKDGRLIFVELKTTKGKVTPDQHTWIDALKYAAERRDPCGLPEHAAFEVHVWRPEDMPRIAEMLLG